MKFLFLHGSTSIPGDVKPTYLAQHSHEVINPALPDDDFAEAVRIAQTEFDQHRPDVVVGSSRGGKFAMSINSRQPGLSFSAQLGRNMGLPRPSRKAP